MHLVITRLSFPFYPVTSHTPIQSISFSLLHPVTDLLHPVSTLSPDTHTLSLLPSLNCYATMSPPHSSSGSLYLSNPVTLPLQPSHFPPCLTPSHSSLSGGKTCHAGGGSSQVGDV
ncbi:hypothetical protein Pcinc_001837 [Petrolisthes cinctipes]|uniref:Uncharacterized protein n=1 Tax=Petrolisthes cinctipes TaxID=88211 RepID=A0AAE1GM29_PETCI|nr:hypothetical protein Pcinc_001837 [Petrolisthes cinctipes]